MPLTITLPYPYPDPATGEWDGFALWRNLQFLAANIPIDIQRVLDRDVIVQDVVNTLDETTVYSFVIPAHTMETNRALRIYGFADYKNDTGASQTFRVRAKFGGTTFFDTNPLSHGAATIRRPRHFQALISAANATNAQYAWGMWVRASITADASLGNAPNFDVLNIGGHNALAVDTTVNQTLSITFTHGAANANLSGRMLAVHTELMV